MTAFDDSILFNNSIQFCRILFIKTNITKNNLKNTSEPNAKRAKQFPSDLSKHKQDN